MKPDGDRSDERAHADAHERCPQAARSWRGRGLRGVRAGGHQREDEEQRPVHVGNEEEQGNPRRKSRVEGPPQRHGDADPEERQRPDGHCGQQPLRSGEQEAFRGNLRGEIVERCPDPSRDVEHGEDVDAELQRRERGAVQEVGAPIDSLGEPEPEEQQPAHCTQATEVPIVLSP